MRVDHTRLRPDPTSTSTHGAEAAQPLLRLFRPHRERKAVSVFGCFGRIGGARLFRLYGDAQFSIWSVRSVAVGFGSSKRNIVIATLQHQTHHRQHDHMLARSSTPRLFRLARLFRLLPIRMIATEVPRGRCSARSACVAGVARDLEQIGIYVEAQLAAGRQISQALAAQADAPAVGCIILQLGTCTRKSWAT